MPRNLFQQAFKEFAEGVIESFGDPENTREHKDEMDTWNTWLIKDHPKWVLMTTFANPELPITEQFSSLGIMDLELFQELVNRPTPFRKQPFALSIITLYGEWLKDKQDILVNLPIRDYHKFQMGLDTPIDVMGEILKRAASLRDVDRSLPEG